MDNSSDDDEEPRVSNSSPSNENGMQDKDRDSAAAAQAQAAKNLQQQVFGDDEDDLTDLDDMSEDDSNDRNPTDDIIDYSEPENNADDRSKKQSNDIESLAPESEDSDDYQVSRVPKMKNPMLKKKPKKTTETAKKSTVTERKRKPKRKRRDSVDHENEDEAPRPPRVLDPTEEKVQAALAEFDMVVNAQKNSRSRRRTEEDDTSWDERMEAMKNEMIRAAEKDQALNRAKKPAFEKLKLLPEVMKDLTITSLHEQWLENEILTAIRAWLEPLDDCSLPSLNIRRSMFDLLAKLPITRDNLRESGIGKIVSFYQKVERELPDIRRQADSLIQRWGRLIVNRTTDYSKKGQQRMNDARERQMATDRRVSEAVATASGVQQDFWAPQSTTNSARAVLPQATPHTYDRQPKNRVKKGTLTQRVPHIPKKLAATMNKMRQNKKVR